MIHPGASRDPEAPEFVASLLTSFVVAAGASAVSTSLGATAALALVRYRFPGRAVLQGLFLSPLLQNWPFGAAVAVALLLIVLLFVTVQARLLERGRFRVVFP